MTKSKYDNYMVNDQQYGKQIYKELMKVHLFGNTDKTHQQALHELKDLEGQGQLRIYYPEEK